MRINKSSAFSEIKLAEGGKVPDRVQILKVGKFNHAQYGKFEITTQILQEMKKNFDERVRGIDIAFDFYHESEKDASGWPKELELSGDGKELWAVGVEWTPKATQKLTDRELRYFSPDFTFKFKDPESGKVINNLLFGGALTNRPFLKEMQPIVADENNSEREKNMTELEQTKKDLLDSQAEVKRLTEELNGINSTLKLAEGGKAAEIKAKIAELQKELAALQNDNKALADKVKLSEENEAKAKKENEFNILLTEGKAVAAQKDAFMRNDMVEFIKLSGKVNTVAAGSSNSGGAGSEDEDDKVIKLSEKLQSEDKSLDVKAAMKMARAQIKEETKK